MYSRPLWEHFDGLVKKWSGFVSGIFHQAQLQGVLWNFDGHWLKLACLCLRRFSSSSVPRHSRPFWSSENVLTCKNYPAMPLAILINFKAFYVILKIIRFCLRRFILSSAVHHFRPFWDRFECWKLPGFVSSSFHQGQLQYILASRAFWEYFDGQILPSFASGGFHQAQL